MWCVLVEWWDVVRTSGMVGCGVYMWNGEMWCVLVEWWDVVCICGMVGCGAY